MTEGLKKVTVSMMNAIHDLPLLVARDEGFFNDEGLDELIEKCNKLINNPELFENYHNLCKIKSIAEVTSFT